MTPLNEIKQGCGIEFVQQSKAGLKYDILCRKGVLCPSCQALLTQTEEIIKEIDIRISLIKGNDEAKLILNELRQKIIGDKK